MFSHFKIKGRLFLLLGCMAFLMIVIGGMGLYVFNDANAALKTVYEDRTVALGQIMTMMKENLRIRVDIANMLILRSNEEVRQREAKITEAVKIIFNQWKEYRATYLTPEEKKLADKTEQDRAAYRDRAMYPIINMINEGRYREAESLFNGGYRELYATVEKDWDDLARIQVDVAKEEYETQQKEYVRFTALLLLIIAGGIGLALLVGFWFARTLITPINRVKEAAEAAAKGDLSRDVTVEAGDEIGEMARSFNGMIGSLRRVTMEINSATASLASSSEELSASADDLNKGSQELASQAEQVVTAMTEVSQTIMDMAKNATQASDAAKNSAETAGTGKHVVDSTTQGMLTIAETVQTAAVTIGELGKNSAQVGEIVSVISGIADQTNLLALNAAIEAARAGEQGRGFAVVADEVRKLAERTVQATKDIAERITLIQAAAGESVHAMQQGSETVDKGVALAKNANQSLDTIVQASREAMDMVQRIAAATEEQSAASEQVTQNMENISGITRQAASSTTQIKQSAADLAQLASKLEQTASWFKLGQMGAVAGIKKTG